MVIVLRGGVVCRSVKPGHMSVHQRALKVLLSVKTNSLKFINTSGPLCGRECGRTENRSGGFYLYTSANLIEASSNGPLILKCNQSKEHLRFKFALEKTYTYKNAYIYVCILVHVCRDIYNSICLHTYMCMHTQMYNDGETYPDYQSPVLGEERVIKLNKWVAFNSQFSCSGWESECWRLKRRETSQAWSCSREL